jgi:hypothetical protein
MEMGSDVTTQETIFIEWLISEPRILVYITNNGRYYFKKYRD